MIIMLVNELVREKIAYDYELMDDDEFVKCPHCGILIDRYWNVFDGRCYCPKCHTFFECKDDE